MIDSFKMSAGVGPEAALVDITGLILGDVEWKRQGTLRDGSVRIGGLWNDALHFFIAGQMKRTLDSSDGAQPRYEVRRGNKVATGSGFISEYHMVGREFHGTIELSGEVSRK